MSLKKISKGNQQREKEIQEELYQCINQKESIIFNSGAGSGKTYALKECLKYVIHEYGNELRYRNQRVLCITYTNVATNEIKSRLGNTDIILVSTIHERIWELIKNHQNELIKIHIENLAIKVQEIQNDINTKKEFEEFRKLSNKEKCAFKKVMLACKDVYYDNYSSKKEELQILLKPYLKNFFYTTNQIGNFKKMMKAFVAEDRYITCMGKIKFEERQYRRVEYDALYNTDQLHRMKISHDTLLEYAFIIISRYDVLKQMIIDKYPYIFIDEYQDTNENVIKIMNVLQEYSEKISHKIFIGYYGDSVQNIYETGVGNRITLRHKHLKVIDKEFNRRSTKEIIDVANNIRNDRIMQKSIFEDCEGGTVKFYSGKAEDVEEFVYRYIKEWEISKENPLNCFMLTNKTVAEHSGFGNIYNWFSRTSAYSGARYNQLNTELLSKDLSKLGDVPRYLFNILQFLVNIEDEKSLLKDILPVSVRKEMNIQRLRELVAILNEINGKTLKETLENIVELYEKDTKGDFKRVVDQVFDLEEISLAKFQEFLLINLFHDVSDSEIEEAKYIIEEILAVSMEEYKLWYKYVLDENTGIVHYHTYHGTKGLEFKNVIIIMGNLFGRGNNKDCFNYFFDNCEQTDLNTVDSEKYNRVKNLLYVSVTRAIQNLRILYIDDISGFEIGIKKIFGEIYYFES